MSEEPIPIKPAQERVATEGDVVPPTETDAYSGRAIRVSRGLKGIFKPDLEGAKVLRVGDAHSAQDAVIASQGDAARITEATQDMRANAQERATHLANSGERTGPSVPV